VATIRVDRLGGQAKTRATSDSFSDLFSVLFSDA
jgi:hypothetical protein